MHENRKIFVHFVDYLICNSYICYQNKIKPLTSLLNHGKNRQTRQADSQYTF